MKVIKISEVLSMIEDVKKEVFKLLAKDDSGHGSDHIERVLQLSLKFAKKEHANHDIVALIALLHDVDDYKLFGFQNAQDLTNAKRIMDKVGIDMAIQEDVLSALQCIGYSKALKGIRAKTIEGKVVSDADMCDAIGANGIIRVYTYSMKHNKPFFNRDIFPMEYLSADEYTKRDADSSVCHIFEKLLKLKNMMLTDSGKEEAKARHQIMVDFLYHLFEEDNANEWIAYFNQYQRREKDESSIL